MPVAPDVLSDKLGTELLLEWVWVWKLAVCPVHLTLFFPPGGVKPEGHGDDHEMVNMEFTCDHCQGLIIGRRMNCNVCYDFDLCYGCYAAKKYTYGYVSDAL